MIDLVCFFFFPLETIFNFQLVSSWNFTTIFLEYKSHMVHLHNLEWMKANPRALNFLGNQHNWQCVFSVPQYLYCSTKKSGVRASKLKIMRICGFFKVITVRFFSFVPLLFNLSGPFFSSKAQRPETCCFNERKKYLDFKSKAFTNTVNTTSLTAKHECWQQLTKQLCTNNTN